jgi:hypothetical protein
VANDFTFVEFRFKRDWETRRAGWVQGRSHVSGSWFPMKYCRNVKAADRYVRRVIARRAEPIAYIDLPLVKVVSND